MRVTDFETRNRKFVKAMADDAELRALTRQWFLHASKYEYSYHFTWMGRPIIQFPQDILALQEIIWRTRPDLILETGIARGGSLVFYASMLELLGRGRVIGIDVDIRPHNRRAIEDHPLFHRIELIEGSSTDPAIFKAAVQLAETSSNPLVCLDSHHSHDHVLKELHLYSKLVRNGGYIVVFDAIIEEMPEEFSANRSWGKGNNPKTAVAEFLKSNDRFVVDHEIDGKLLITVAPSGYLKCIKD